MTPEEIFRGFWRIKNGSSFFWGALSGGAVLLGAIISMIIHIPRKILGFIMAFGVGVLIGAATFELLQESLDKVNCKIH